MQKETQETSFNEKINDFFQKRRTPVIISLVVVAAGFAGFLGFYLISNMLQKSASSKIEELNTRYEAIQAGITADSSDDELITLIGDLETFGKKSGSYAGGKAYSLLANIYQKKHQFPEMEAAWINSANKARRTFLAPIAWFNAASAAEEQGDFDRAIEHYTKSLSTPVKFPAGVQSQFSIGRLREELGDTDGAIEAYRALISGWSQDAVWANLARSRIVALEIQKQ